MHHPVPATLLFNSNKEIVGTQKIDIQSFMARPRVERASPADLPGLTIHNEPMHNAFSDSCKALFPEGNCVELPGKLGLGCSGKGEFSVSGT
jgi:hypothetical protein